MIISQCVKCIEQYCTKKDWKLTQLPEFCPMKHKKEIIEKALIKYEEKNAKELYVKSTITEQKAYQMV